MANEYAEKHNVPLASVLNVIATESAGNPYASDGTRFGLMKIDQNLANKVFNKYSSHFDISQDDMASKEKFAQLMMQRPDANINMGVLALKENRTKLGSGDWNEATAAHHLGDQIVNNALQIMNLDKRSKQHRSFLEKQYIQPAFLKSDKYNAEKSKRDRDSAHTTVLQSNSYNFAANNQSGDSHQTAVLKSDRYNVEMNKQEGNSFQQVALARFNKGVNEYSLNSSRYNMLLSQKNMAYNPSRQISVGMLQNSPNFAFMSNRSGDAQISVDNSLNSNANVGINSFKGGNNSLSVQNNSLGVANVGVDNRSLGVANVSLNDKRAQESNLFQDNRLASIQQSRNLLLQNNSAYQAVLNSSHMSQSSSEAGMRLRLEQQNLNFTGVGGDETHLASNIGIAVNDVYGGVVKNSRNTIEVNNSQSLTGVAGESVHNSVQAGDAITVQNSHSFTDVAGESVDNSVVENHQFASAGLAKQRDMKELTNMMGDLVHGLRRAKPPVRHLRVESDGKLNVE
jgi:hypothetical protein